MKHTIDVTPNWVDLIPLFVDWIKSGNSSQRRIAIDELTKIAKLADWVKEHRKHNGLTCKCGEILEFING